MMLLMMNWAEEVVSPRLSGRSDSAFAWRDLTLETFLILMEPTEARVWLIDFWGDLWPLSIRFVLTDSSFGLSLFLDTVRT